MHNEHMLSFSAVAHEMLSWAKPELMQTCNIGTPTSEAATPPATQPFCQQQLTTSMADSGSSGGKMRHPKFPSSNIWHPGSQEERAMDDLDYANWMVFGNRSFRLDQHNIIKAALQVGY